jgi:methylated-DNA-[protein]-cysteine S-methyltransferase
MSAPTTVSSRLVTTVVDSPLGPLRLYADEAGLCGLYFDGHRPAPPAGHAAADPDVAAFGPFMAQLAAYFADSSQGFDVTLSLRGTEFQQAVWAALRSIPPGHTETYGEVARRIGRPSAVRAVGSAIGRNPVSIVVPCHRVVGSGGSLTGYAGGTERKAWLLGHERA